MDTYVILESSKVKEDQNPHNKRVETSRRASIRLICCYLFFFIITQGSVHQIVCTR